jgi:hypothetical protein
VRVAISIVAASLLCAPLGVLAQDATVTGVVLDTLRLPIPGVLVFVDDGQPYATTDSLGMFRLERVTRATHRLNYRGTGYAPRAFNLDLLPDDQTLDVGRVTLRPGAPPTATLTGSVVEQVGGQPLAGAVIEVNGTVLAETDSAGAFSVQGAPILWGPNAVRVTHRSFTDAQTTDEFWIGSPNETVELSVTLDVAVVALPGVNVEAGPARIPGLVARGFYERMENTPSGAVFWTSEDIDARDVDDWDDLMRGIRMGRPRAATTFGRAGTGVCGVNTEALAFLDGAYIGYVSSLARSVRPETIAGVEVYQGIAGLPIEFNLHGADCGVVVVWTFRGTR